MSASTYIAVLFSFLFLAAAAVARADKWDAQWKKVDEAVQKGLPKTAIEQLQPILDGAIAEKNYPVAIKAIGRKIALEGIIQGNKPEEKITRLDAEIAKAPAEMQPMLEVVQADWYWQYFLHNRWRFMQRTATAAAPGKDFTTWDLPRLFAEIDKHFQKALAAAEQLKKIPIGVYQRPAGKRAAMPDSYRPTLYDFVAHQALDFYNSGEQAAAKAEDAFELSADGPIFRPVEEFIAWKPESHAMPIRPTLKAIRLYQQLLRFHQNDDDKTAFLDVDLERLNLGHNKAVGEEKATLYKVALQRFVKENGATIPFRPSPASIWPASCSRKTNWSMPTTWPSEGMRAFPRYARRDTLLQPGEADRGEVGQHHDRAGVERAVADDPRELSQRDEGLLPPRPRGLAGADEERPVPRRVAGRRPAAGASGREAGPGLVGRPAARPRTSSERIEDLPAPTDLKPGYYFLAGQPRCPLQRARTTSSRIRKSG